ncbi:MAG TPA: galactokinase, partial [Myxococcaceae bacterium]|nr:galactokinase [Myxococcaceae bacterium]
LFRAPGRVNLIGEHTDYNDGFVLPMALERATVIAAAPREDRRVEVVSSGHAPTAFDLDAQWGGTQHAWTDYVEGVARVLESAGHRLRGANLMVESDVPSGAGLSSSAALEISVGQALLSLSGIPVDAKALALWGQKAEHQYVGMLCGVMDQFIVALGKAAHALLIDCRSLEARPVPLDLSRHAVVVCDSGVKHQLASSEYNLRRAECEKGVELLRPVMPAIRALRDVSPQAFEEHQKLLPDVVRRRVRHVVTENARTLAAAQALEGGKPELFGELMAQSHASLRDDYQVSCDELDVLVELASALPQVLGARMTGGGFGGCTVNLVNAGGAEEMQRKVAEGYQRRFGRIPATFITRAGDGAREL